MVALIEPVVAIFESVVAIINSVVAIIKSVVELIEFADMIFVFVVRIFVFLVAILFVVAIFVSVGTKATAFRENIIHFHIRILHENRIRMICRNIYLNCYSKKKMQEEIIFHSHVFIQT